MSGTVERRAFHPVRLFPKDLGVAIVVLVALALGGLLRYQVEGGTRTFEEPDSPFRITYPALWTGAESLQDVLLRVEDPRAKSTFKTALTVESQGLDPASPPTLQTIVDRRIAGHEALTAYRLLENTEATVDGARGARIDYAYVVQPIDVPRRAAPPVVVRAREYVVVARDRTYYITLAAPEGEYEGALARFERIIEQVQIQ